MASIIIRSLEDDVKLRLKQRAAANLRSMEEEARDILREAVGATDPRADLGQQIHARFKALGGISLALPKRGN
ncbi:FitA-like ribbon-helix-helix domain-containing protein [Paragemmobacter straminiformis]|uniref:Plasmid stabilization protein n=1 Tax=Paragemmobacter straminiformis TaxID=2045119 RepID=A0A842IA47_9RHOB|nr:plasmid stabilization protein [Gemmobacter straminiformis]MBC2836227.1 plasmid stabilization protein [Gemmobacter straminiformis]